MRKLKLGFWYNTILGGVVAVCVIGGLLVATQSSKPYDEKTYLLGLCIIGFLVVSEVLKEAEKYKQRIKRLEGH